MVVEDRAVEYADRAEEFRITHEPFEQLAVGQHVDGERHAVDRPIACVTEERHEEQRGPARHEHSIHDGVTRSVFALLTAGR